MKISRIDLIGLNGNEGHHYEPKEIDKAMKVYRVYDTETARYYKGDGCKSLFNSRGDAIDSLRSKGLSDHTQVFTKQSRYVIHEFALTRQEVSTNV